MTRKSGSLAAAACSTISVALMFAPAWFTNSVRHSVRDLLRPGQALASTTIAQVELLTQNFSPSSQADAEIKTLKSRLSIWTRRCRQLGLQNARLQERMRSAAHQDISPFQPTSGEPLVMPELITSAVLGRERSAIDAAGLLIDKGDAARIIPSVPVLAGDGPLIDQGADVGLMTDQPVYSGWIVVGKIAGVGRWTSTVRPVTDENYRGRAQLVRETSVGFAFGAEGVLEGTGQQLCRLTRIGADAQVRVGDGVYTADHAPALPCRMYYGKVVKAELPSGALEWEIHVEPAVENIELHSVQVLRTRLNPERLMGN